MKDVLLRWRAVFLYLLVLYGTLPFVGPASSWAQGHALGWFIRYAAPVLLLAGGLAMACWIPRSPTAPRGVAFLLLGGVAAAYYAILVYMVQAVVERFHAVLFAVLTFLVYRALRQTTRGFRLLAYVAVFVFAVGFVDETIQGLMKDRLYDNRDILMNLLSGVLLLVMLRTVWPPPPHAAPTRRPWTRDALALLLVAVVSVCMLAFRRVPLPPERIVGTWSSREDCGTVAKLTFEDDGSVAWRDGVGNWARGRYTLIGNRFHESVLTVRGTAAHNASDCGWHTGWKGSTLLRLQGDTFFIYKSPTPWNRAHETAEQGGNP